MDSPPVYLARSQYNQHSSKPLDPDEEVGNSELLYRRVVDREYPNREYFMGLQSGFFNEGKGFSVNRSKHSSNPKDVLWVGSNYERGNKCIYEFQERHMVVYCQVQDLVIVNNAFEIIFFCKFTPEDCNVAHTNIFSNPPLKTSFTKSERRDIILKLASVFEAV